MPEAARAAGAAVREDVAGRASASAELLAAHSGARAACDEARDASDAAAAAATAEAVRVVREAADGAECVVSEACGAVDRLLGESDADTTTHTETVQAELSGAADAATAFCEGPCRASQPVAPVAALSPLSYKPTLAPAPEDEAVLETSRAARGAHDEGASHRNAETTVPAAETTVTAEVKSDNLPPPPRTPPSRLQGPRPRERPAARIEEPSKVA